MCLDCNLPSKTALVGANANDTCSCPEFRTECDTGRVRQFQDVTNEVMYEKFKAEHPSIAAYCSLTTFISFKPWWIGPPHVRSCECIHHITFRKLLEDCAAAHKRVHSKCAPGNKGGCRCKYCQDGACLDDSTFTRNGGVADRVLCPKADPADAILYKCAKGTCDDCGWFESFAIDSLLVRGLHRSACIAKKG